MPGTVLLTLQVVSPVRPFVTPDSPELFPRLALLEFGLLPERVPALLAPLYQMWPTLVLEIVRSTLQVELHAHPLVTPDSPELFPPLAPILLGLSLDLVSALLATLCLLLLMLVLETVPAELPVELPAFLLVTPDSPELFPPLALREFGLPRELVLALLASLRRLWKMLTLVPALLVPPMEPLARLAVTPDSPELFPLPVPPETGRFPVPA